MDVISPSTEAPVGSVPLATNADIDRAVAAARQAFDSGPWPAMTPAERADVLDRAAASLRKREAEIAAVTVDEMGCAISQAPQAQTGFTAALFGYYASLARTFEFSRTVAAGARAGIVDLEPVGVVAIIVPWNAPVTLACWKAAPALAAGCPVIIKPAPEAPLSNFVLADALREAGLPEGVVSVIPAGREVGEYLVTHPGTDKIAYTGSTAAGKRIMSLCGEQVKRVSLELGGKSASVILDDTDIATIIPRVVHGAMHLAGQVCGAHTRVLVPRARYGAAVEAAAAGAAHVVTGDPHDPATMVGPLAAERQRDRVEGYIKLALDAGARLAAGGGRPADLPRGWYVEPTILADVDNSMRVAREEIFGPVLCFIPYDTDDEAVTIANDSPYGRGASRSTAATRPSRSCRSAASRSRASAAARPEGLLNFLEPRSIGLLPELHPGS